MIRGLFARLTAHRQRGGELFGGLIAEARRPHWYAQGQVPDSVDGRFAMLATVVALATVRLEDGGESGQRQSIALAERFIEAMDAEHRQMGVSDPAIGKTVRRLVGALARRVELWREAVAHADWSEATRRSVYRDSAVGGDALGHTSAALRELWQGLEDGRNG